MHSSTLFAAISVLFSCTQSVLAHSFITSVNGQTKCLRGTNINSIINFPVFNPMSKDMECNVLGQTPASSTCSFEAGEEMTLRWHHNPDDPKDDVIAESHKGPCAVYISQPGTGKWFKIFEEGYKNGQWCTDRLRANKGNLKFVLPKELANGKWLLRGEVIALHEGHKLYSEQGNAAQYYMRCMDIEVGGGMGKTIMGGVSIPGYIRDSDPGIHFSIYNQDPSTYTIPGPRLATFGGASTDAYQGMANQSKSVVDQPKSGNGDYVIRNKKCKRGVSYKKKPAVIV